MHTKTKGLSQYEGYYGDPKNLLTCHAKTEIFIILCLLNAWGQSEEEKNEELLEAHRRNACG